MLSQFPRFIASAACLLAGVLAALSFAPTEFWWLMPFCLAILIRYWCNASPKQALLYGFCFGLGLYLHGIVWIVIIAHEFNGADYWLAWIIHFLIACTLASYIAVVGYLQAKLLRAKSLRMTQTSLLQPSQPSQVLHPPKQLINDHKQAKSVDLFQGLVTHDAIFWQRALLVGVLWVLADWLRGNVLSNFPWLELGYSQTGFALSGYATLGGVSLVSFVLLLSAFCLLNVLSNFSVSCVKHSVVGLIGLCALFAGAVILQTVQWSRPIAPSFSAALVQANIPIKQKWQEHALDRIVKTYYEQTQTLDVDLAIWPETAIPTRLQRVDKSFWRKTAPVNGELISGIEQVIDERTFNTAIMTCRKQQQIYHKQRLVPFGEYIPFRSLTKSIAQYIGLEVHQYGQSDHTVVFDCDSLTKIGVSICFEIAFPRLIRQQALQAHVLVSLSEDAWFGDSAATFQRLQMARMRAIEFSRPMLASSNTGPSAMIDHRGRIQHMSANYVQQTVQGQVVPQQGMTPFLQWGDWFVLFCLCLSIVYLIIFLLKLKQ